MRFATASLPTVLPDRNVAGWRGAGGGPTMIFSSITGAATEAEARNGSGSFLPRVLKRHSFQGVTKLDELIRGKGIELLRVS